MKKVLFIIPSLATGGAEKVLVNILNNIDRTGFDITLLTIYSYTSESNVLDKSIRRISFIKSKRRIIHSITYKLFCRILSSKMLYRLMVKDEYDVEVAFLEGLSTKIISGSTNKNSKKIAWIHTDLDRFRDSDYCYKDEQHQTECYSKYNEIISVSEDVRNAFLRRFGSVVKTRVIYNPVDRMDVLKKSKIPMQSPFHHDRFHFVAVGRLTKQKAFDKLIEACSILKNHNLEFDLCIVGEGTLHSDLDKLIREKNLMHQVILYGFAANPYQIMNLSDAIVASSEVEGFPLVIIEAMILGKPIVSTDVTGPREILEHGKWGLLVDCNAEAIASGMKEMMIPKNYNKYKKLSEERAISFCFEDTIRQISSVLSD